MHEVSWVKKEGEAIQQNTVSILAAFVVETSRAF